MRLVRLFTTTVLLALLAAACGSAGGADPPESGAETGGGAAAFEQPFKDVEAYPVFVSTELSVGPNRFLIGLLDDNDAPIGNPNIDVSVAFYDLKTSSSEPEFERDLDFMWAVKPERGLYVTNVDFDRAGKWGAEVFITGEGLDEDVKGSFSVKESSNRPALGAKVPASDTPTLADVEDISEISTDNDPDRRFYQTSVAQSVRQHEPFVLVFATPKFCTSQVCGPMLDIVKSVAPKYPDVNFIHVEVYTNLDDPSNLKPVPSTAEWGLPSEPWVFVADRDGRLAAKFEGVLGPSELRAVLDKQV